MSKKENKKKKKYTGKKRGRKDKWEQLDMKSKLPLITYWAMNGKTEKSMAESLGVSVALFERWKNEKLELLEALKEGREVVDATVVNSLLKKARGYSVEEEELEEFRDDDGDLVNSKRKSKIKHVPASDTAMIFWLKNRLPDEFKDRVENHNTGGFVFDVNLTDNEEDEE